MRISKMICINCLNKGHAFKDCNYPIKSYGVIGYKKIKDEIKFILVQRKDTMGYIDFIRGRFDRSLKKEDVYKVLVQEMTFEEKKRLLELSFDELWDDMWMNKKSKIYKNEYFLAKKKYNEIDVHNMVKDSIASTKWKETEYSIPKGRRNNVENFIDCAIREFSEETGYGSHCIKIIQNVLPFEEVFTGSNLKSYKHCYYVANMVEEPLCVPNFQKTEVSDMKWLTYEEAKSKFRNYNLEKLDILTRVNTMLTNYRICA